MNGGEPLFFKVRKRGEDFSLQYLEAAEGICGGTTLKILEKYLKNGFYLDIGASQSKVRSFLSAAVILSLIDFFPTPLLVRDLLQGVI